MISFIKLVGLRVYNVLENQISIGLIVVILVSLTLPLADLIFRTQNLRLGFQFTNTKLKYVINSYCFIQTASTSETRGRKEANQADVIRGEHVSWSKDELTIYYEFDSIVSTKKPSIST